MTTEAFSKPNQKLLRIMIADDNPHDFYLLKRAAQKAKVNCEFEWIENGQQVLDRLKQTAKLAAMRKAKKPHVVLLDLNMPGISGRATLKQIREDQDISDVPIVIFSTSKTPEDIKNAYSRGVSAFVTKPFDYQDYIHFIQDFYNYWVKYVQLAYP